MEFTYWVKFNGNPRPERFVFKNMDEMWHTLREFMMREPRRYGFIEWMIRD